MDQTITWLESRKNCTSIKSEGGWMVYYRENHYAHGVTLEEAVRHAKELIAAECEAKDKND